MESYELTPREKLRFVYELAFYPPRLHEFWADIKQKRISDNTLIKELLTSALDLHKALPEKGFQSKSALKRVARYQAESKSFGQETFMKNIAQKLSLNIITDNLHIPPGMIRDIALPEFCHRNNRTQRASKNT